MESIEKGERDWKFIGVAIVTIIVVVGLWLATYFSLKDYSDPQRGTFGDMFGGINALFSGLAFGGIILTILLQRKELSLQRLELEETRKELKRSADAQERSEATFRNQQNQTTFFNLISNHKVLLERIKFDEMNGFEGVRKFATNIRANLILYNQSIENKTFNNFKSTANNPYYLIKQYNSAVKTYLKNLETIVNFLNRNFDDRELFSEILYNSLSVPEKYLLGIFYYYGKSYGTEFLKLKDHYNFLDYYESELERHKNNPDKYFPGIEVTGNFRRSFNDKTLENKTNVLNLVLNVHYLFSDCSLKLEDIKLKIRHYMHDNSVEGASIFKLLELKDENKVFTINFTGNFINVVKDLPEGEYYFDYEFHFLFKGTKYMVGYQHNFTKELKKHWNPENYEDYYQEIEYEISLIN